MSSFVDRLDDAARRRVDRLGRETVRPGELLRHPLYTRALHWLVAIFFILSLLTGFAIYTPWLYRAITPLFGGGPMTRLLHPWFGLGFTAVFLLQFLNWLRPMTWTSADSRWIRRMRHYVSNEEAVEPPEVGFFNGGQKAYFWVIVGSTVVLLITGLMMWLPEVFGRTAVAIGYVLHDIAAIVMLGGFILHLYESTAQQPGTFRSMTRGSVTRRWAWTHHPGWYEAVTGRDPRADYERALQRERDRAREHGEAES